jgi:restriction system protein
MADATLWGIHAGKTGDADKLFREHECVALGWPDMGDLTTLPPTREAFKARMVETYPQSKPGAIPVNAGQLFRFVHEAKDGDLVAYPSKRDRRIYFGRVTGGYRFDPADGKEYAQQRSVTWLKDVPRTAFSQGALHEIGSAMSFFQLKNYADEFVAVVEGAAPADAADDDVATVAQVSEDTEETTRDFILKRLARDLKGKPLEYFIAHLLEAMGYQARVPERGADGGVDVIAHKDQLGFEPPIIKVQVKSSDSSVGDPAVSQLVGKVNAQGGEFALFVTLGTFTPQARNTARNQTNLRLIDGDELVGLILEHYERFDASYKGVLPLKRVYIPQPIEG